MQNPFAQAGIQQVVVSRDVIVVHYVCDGGVELSLACGTAGFETHPAALLA